MSSRARTLTSWREMSSASYFTMYGALWAALTPAPRARDSETEENQQLRGGDDDDDDFSDEDDYEEYEELVRPLPHGPAQLDKELTPRPRRKSTRRTARRSSTATSRPGSSSPAGRSPTSSWRRLDSRSRRARARSLVRRALPPSRPSRRSLATDPSPSRSQRSRGRRRRASTPRSSRSTPSASSSASTPTLARLADPDARLARRVGQLLSRYKSGPLPKAFKILPTLPMWPALVMLTNPESWTPHATYAATRIFASNLDPKQSQKFYKEILLEKVREEIGESGKLSVHTYMALKKAIYKPAAFFKGLLFPLCEVPFLPLAPPPPPLSSSAADPCFLCTQSGTCTLREAAILGSVLTKVSVPVLHSGAALLKLAEMEYTGASPPFSLSLSLPRPVPDGPTTRNRPEQRLHPGPARQEVRAAVQGRRRARVPLPAVQARHAPDARPVAPVVPRLCPAVRPSPLPLALPRAARAAS